MKPVRMIEPFGAGGVVFAAQICVPRQTQTPAFIRLLRGFGATEFRGKYFGGPGKKNFLPTIVFDPVAINTLKAKGITFEAAFSGFGNDWVGRP